MIRYLYHGICSFSFLVGCLNQEDTRFQSPYNSFKTHQQAILDNDLDVLWESYSNTYRNQQIRATWRREWENVKLKQKRELLDREIAKEQIINDEIAYILLDSSTLRDDRQSPFVYFVRENRGWKITTHLDSVFHRALESALKNGDYKLPTR